LHFHSAAKRRNLLLSLLFLHSANNPCTHPRAVSLRTSRTRHRRTLQPGKLLRPAASPLQPRQIRLHLLVLGQRSKHRIQYRSRPPISRTFQTIMHPLAVPPRAHQPGSPQIRQMPRDLRLPLAQNLDKVADAHLAPAHQVQQTQARRISQRCKHQRQINWLLCLSHKNQYIRLDKYVYSSYIRFSKYEGGRHGR